MQIKKHEEGDRPFSLKLSKYLTASGIGDFLELTNVILSLIIVVLHFIDTYYWPRDDYSVDEPDQNIIVVEMVINFYLLADLALNCYISENKLLFVFKSTSIIEYASILPSLLTRLGAYQGNKFILLTRSLRYLLIHKLEPIFARRSMDVLKHIFRVLYAATSIMILGASFLMVVEV